MPKPESVSPKLKKWQNTTLFSLMVGYAGYYFCRTNFSIATPLLLDEFGDQGIDKETIGYIVSVGVFFYAVGKFFNGILCDFIGGRRMFLVGMVGSIIATIAFGLGTGATVFLVAWSANRLVQSMGWGALVKITSNWFAYNRYGTVMAFLSLSYLFGDALARLSLGQLIEFGIGWRGIFFSAAGVLTVLAIWNYFMLKSSPTDIGEEEPEVNPVNLYGEEGEEHKPESLKELLVPFFTSFGFWMAAIMSLGLTLIRESFTFWTPTYLAEVGNLTAGQAAQFSLLFPFFGGVSVIITGYLTDKYFEGRRGAVIIGALVPLVGLLWYMGTMEAATTIAVPLVLVSLAALLLIGPYAFIAGAIALDLGGKKGSSTAAGLFDSVGYFGGILSGVGVAMLAQRLGWNAVFLTLGGVTVVTLIAAILYWKFHEGKVELAEN